MRLLVMADTHYGSIGGVNMPKARPTQVIVHRIELQEKERELIEAITTTQTMKNLAYAGAAVGITAVGYLGWKTFHEVKTGDEASIFNLLTKEGRNKQRGFVKTRKEHSSRRYSTRLDSIRLSKSFQEGRCRFGHPIQRRQQTVQRP